MATVGSLGFLVKSQDSTWCCSVDVSLWIQSKRKGISDLEKRWSEDSKIKSPTQPTAFLALPSSETGQSLHKRPRVLFHTNSTRRLALVRFIFLIDSFLFFLCRQSLRFPGTSSGMCSPFQLSTFSGLRLSGVPFLPSQQLPDSQLQCLRASATSLKTSLISPGSYVPSSLGFGDRESRGWVQAGPQEEGEGEGRVEEQPCSGLRQSSF